MFDYVYLYLLTPLHTGGTTQEGNLIGIARESHTELPYIPSSSIRGRLRASISDRQTKFQLFGNDLEDPNSDQLKQGDVWIGDGSILWLPVPSLSHGVVWISSPILLRRWAKFNNLLEQIPDDYNCSFADNNSPIYLKDAIIKNNKRWLEPDWKKFVPQSSQTSAINRVLVLPDNHCATLIQMSLWRQVKIKLDSNKIVDGGFRYEEAIPPDTLMYFPWGINSAANADPHNSREIFEKLIENKETLQIGGQESLGRGFVQPLTIGNRS